MSSPIFDLDDFGPLFRISKDMAVDEDGSFSLRMGDNMAMDMDTGEMRFTTSWDSDDSWSSDAGSGDDW